MCSYGDFYYMKMVLFAHFQVNLWFMKFQPSLLNSALRAQVFHVWFIKNEKKLQPHVLEKNYGRTKKNIEEEVFSEFFRFH